MMELLGINSDELKSSEGSKKLIKELSRIGYKRANIGYINTHDGGIGLLFKKIKAGYKKYVIEKGWSERKYRDVIIMLAADRVPYSYPRVESYGKQWGTKEFNVRLNNEAKRYREFRR